MTIGVVLDTHSAVWYLSSDSRLSRIALNTIESTMRAGETIFIPSICLVELTYLIEKGRMPRQARDRLTAVLDNPQSGWTLVPLSREVAEALRSVSRADVPDLPDRVVAATGVALRCSVVSRDREIRTSGILTIW